MMSGSMTRRGVLSGAVAIAGVSALPRFLNPHSAIGHVVVDERLSHSAAFASGFTAARMHVVNALDDLCNSWYTRLRQQVLADAGHIAGLTTWMDYLVMRGCAGEIAYAGAFHAEHIPAGAGLTHAVTAHPDLATQLALLAQPRKWASAMGEALASGAHLRSRFVPGQVFSATTAVSSAPQRMVTWVFSPR